MSQANSFIVIVDDTKTMRMTIKNKFKSLGFENLLEADNGRTAIDVIEDKLASGGQIDAVFSDISMPVMTGIEFLKWARSHPILKKTPFVMITAESGPGLMQTAKSEGASGYLIKPFADKDLFDLVQAIGLTKKAS